jgi:2'-5' RNA ligase
LAAARESALIVVVPEAEPAVHEWRAAHTWDAKRGVPAHVTILYPFVPADELEDAVLAALRELAARHEAFAFRLERTARWPDGIVYLPPEPQGPFVALIEAVCARWPEHPPYGGIHDENLPHLTVIHDAGFEDEAAAAVEPALPIACEAVALSLLVEGHDGWWRLHSAFPFAVRPAS